MDVVGVLILAVLMVFGSYVSAKNQMVAKDQNVKTAWSEVDVQLERRADLIPNLVETVKGFTKEESTVFGDIANARAGMLNAQGPAAKIAANGQLDGALGRLLLLTENYPQLRSSDQFMRLQDELAGTENRIGVARKRYNDASAGLQHLRAAVPQQHLGGDGRIQAERCVFQGQPGGAAGAGGEVLGLSFPRSNASRHPSKMPNHHVGAIHAKRPSRRGMAFFTSAACEDAGYLKEAMALASSS